MKKLSLSKGLHRGFTLIELLVVVAIIGILASVVLASLNTARSKGADAAIKADMSGVRASAEVQYDTNGNKYGTAAAAGLDCGLGNTTGNPATSVFSNASIQAALVHAKAQSGGATALYCTQDANGTAYAIAAPLKSGGFWCIDSTGAARGTVGTSTTAYTATNGTGGAIASSTTYACS